MTAAGLDVMTVGYASLDRAFRSARIAGPAQTGLLADTASPPLRDGGCGPNTARWLALFGLRSGLITWVGDDAEGIAFRDRLLADGVDPVGIELGAGESPRSLLIYDETGHAACYFYPGRSAEQVLSLELQQATAGATWLAITVAPEGVTRQALASRSGSDLLAWNVKADPDAFPPDLCARLCTARVVCLNDAELEFVLTQLGARPADGVGELLRRGAEWVVVTRGRDGWSIHTRDGTVQGPAELAEVKDATGAGDAFFAGLLAARLRGAEAAQAGAQAATTSRRALTGELRPTTGGAS